MPTCFLEDPRPPPPTHQVDITSFGETSLILSQCPFLWSHNTLTILYNSTHCTVLPIYCSVSPVRSIKPMRSDITFCCSPLYPAYKNTGIPLTISGFPFSAFCMFLFLIACICNPLWMTSLKQRELFCLHRRRPGGVWSLHSPLIHGTALT